MKKEQVKLGMVVYSKSAKWYERVLKLGALGSKLVLITADSPTGRKWEEIKNLRPLTARERGDTQ